MATYTDVYDRRVQFTDGEALSAVDLGAVQGLLQRQSVVNLLLSGVADAIDDPTSPGSALDLEGGSLWNSGALGAFPDLVFAPFPGCGFVRPTGNTRELECVPGPLVLQHDGAPFDDSQVYAVRLGTNTFTTAVGDATNPRIDLVEIRAAQLITDSTVRNFEDAISRALTSSSTNKTDGVEVTIQIKQGTPSATPAYPTPTSGFVALAAVYVPATHNAVHSADNLRDMRMPLGGIDVYESHPLTFWRPGTNPWSISHANMAVAANATGTDPLYIHCPFAGKNGRLVGIGVHGLMGFTNSCKLNRYDVRPDLGVQTHTLLATLTSELWDLTEGFKTASLVQLADALGAQTPANGTRVANTRTGSPIWCGGWAGGVARPRAASPEEVTSRLELEIRSEDTAYVHFVRWYVARGL